MISTVKTGAEALALLTAEYLSRHPGNAARDLEALAPAEGATILAAANIDAAAAVIGRMDPDAACEMLAVIDDATIGNILRRLDARHAAMLLLRLDGEHRERRLALLPPSIAKEISVFLTYPPESAGWLMDPRFIVCRPDETVGTALTRVRARPDRRILDLCIIDADQHLKGLVPMQSLAVSPDDVLVGSLFTDAPLYVHAMAHKDEIVDLLERSKVTTLPVCDLDRRLLGVIRHDELVSAARLDASADIQSMVGASRDERALSSSLFAVRKRLVWLEINLLTAFLAAAVVGLFEGTIAKVTALAVLLPVVAGQSGNAGAQALAVTLRGLALREIRPRNWGRVARKEVGAGVINGIAIALTTAAGVFVWSSSLPLALVIAVSMVVSMVMAGLAGASIPVILTAVGQDPAQSSSIFLTTVTDIVGFMSFLGLAALSIDHLPIG